MTTTSVTTAAKKSTAPRIYHIPIPTGKPIVCRKVLLALTEWRAMARGIQHFDEESGRATWDDLCVMEASGECHIEVLLLDERRGDTFWAPAHYDASGEYAAIRRKPHQVSVIVRATEETDADDIDTDRHWQPIAVQSERPKREAPAAAIGTMGRRRGDDIPVVAMTLWE